MGPVRPHTGSDHRSRGRNPNDGRFARYLEREKILIERSKKDSGYRVHRRAAPSVGDWHREFKIDLDDAPGGSLAEDVRWGTDDPTRQFVPGPPPCTTRERR